MLELTDIEYRRRADLPPVITGITLTISRGELIGVVGANGAGKSTLARLLAGLIEPTAGHIAEQHHVRRAFVTQDPAAQIVGETALADVAFGLEIAGVASHEIDERALHALRMVGVDHLAERDPRTLSGGEQQRIAIAGAVALAPELMILDEPTSQLDHAARAAVAGVIGGTMRAAGCAGVWVTQEPDELAMCSRVIAIDAGGIVFDGAPAALYADATVAGRLGIGLPAAVALRRELAGIGVLVGGDDALTVEALAMSLLGAEVQQ